MDCDDDKEDKDANDPNVKINNDEITWNNATWITLFKKTRLKRILKYCKGVKRVKAVFKYKRATSWHIILFIFVWKRMKSTGVIIWKLYNERRFPFLANAKDCWENTVKVVTEFTNFESEKGRHVT